MTGRRTYPTTPMCDGDLLALFEPTTRDSDVFITTSAKCGQTWLQTLLFHLKTGGREPDLRGVGLGGVSPWLELPSGFMAGSPEVDHATRLAELEAIDDPRVFKLHVVWDDVPRPPGSKARVMTVTRDPRDVPWSMYSHVQAMKPGAGPPVADFGTWFERWFEFGFYWKFVRSMWPHRADPDVLWLRYEDLHRDLRAEAERIIAFLGWDVAEDELLRALALVDFGRMRAAEKSTIFSASRAVWKEEGHFFREGAVGKNREHLTADQERRILERTEADLGPECFAFLVDR